MQNCIGSFFLSETSEKKWVFFNKLILNYALSSNMISSELPILYKGFSMGNVK